MGRDGGSSFPLVPRLGAVGAGIGAGCGVGIGVGKPINISARSRRRGPFPATNPSTPPFPC